MRQRRQRLQVSTFPFLAVLLCAMGSLILLLVVIDRRAKVVARVKAMRAMGQALAQATAEDEKAAAAHRAEWERRRQLLHEQLLQQDQQVLGEIQAVQSKAAATAGSVQAALAHNRALQEQLQAERAGLARSEEEVSAGRAEAAKAARQADASRTELAALTADLERMEHTLAELKAARERRQHLYSLVPYRGKRGDTRKPIYLECSGDDLIFHPDRQALHGLRLTPSGVRGEIERRLKAVGPEPLPTLGRTTSSDGANDKAHAHAYLLMLVRPNGITTYYRTLGALKGLPIDFGYEFIDQDWILDFSEDENAPAQQPWVASAQSPGIEASGAQKVKRSVPVERERPRRNYQGLPPGRSVWGRPTGILAADPAGADNARSPSSAGAGQGDDVRAGKQGGFGRVADPGAGAQAVGIPSSVSGPGVGTGNGPESARGEVLAGVPFPPAAQAAPQDGTFITAPRQPLRPSDVSPAYGGATQGVSFGQGDSRAENGTPRQPSESQAAPDSDTGERRAEVAAGDSRTPASEGPPSLLPRFGPNRPGTVASSTTDGSAPTAEGADHGNPSEGRPGSGEPSQRPTGDPLESLAAQNPSRKPVRPAPLRPGFLAGNRDWIIPIECTADALVLRSSGQRIATAELARGDGTKNILLETVQRMIARRQATVRPGDLPYRPMIRFRVWPDGVRSYYLAYPALEALRVPMSRENVDPEP